MPPHYFSWGGDCPPGPPYGALPVIVMDSRLLISSGAALSSASGSSSSCGLPLPKRTKRASKSGGMEAI